MQFVINREPFRVTAQQKRVTYANGKPHFYYPEKLQESYNAYLNDVWPYRPEKPLEGPLQLHISFYFGTKDKKRWGKAKPTKPDTDNLIKGFKDVLTAAGFWKDDAQVVFESTYKAWQNRGCIIVDISKYEDFIGE